MSLLFVCVCSVCACIKQQRNISSSSGANEASEFVFNSYTCTAQRKSKSCLHAEDDAMSEVLSVDAILFGLLVFSGILGNILVIHVVR